MTINCCCTRKEERSIRLTFGVPLEDIFPINDIHPYLKGLFIAAYQNIIICGYSIENVISKLQGTLRERLRLKDDVHLCKPMSGYISPGSLLWVIRHFIGLLPLPLLPDFSDGRTFSWYRLTRFCKNFFLRDATTERNSHLLTQKIVGELLRLPAPNLLLFGVLLNFIRVLIINRRRTSKIDKLAASCLVKYFSSSIFLRPFRPGYTTKVDREYFPLLLYMVVKWVEIEKILRVKSVDMNLSKTPFYHCPLNKSYYSECCNIFLTRLLKPNKNIVLNRNVKNVSTQTLNFVFDSTSQLEELNNEVTFLRDVGIQTDLFMHCAAAICCCSYGSNYETQLIELKEENENKHCQTDSQIESDELLSNSPSTKHTNRAVNTNTSYYGWIYPNSTNEQNEDSPKTFVTEGEYIYDEYLSSTINLMNNNNLTNKKSVSPNDPNLLKRISKIGWTYTPPKCLSNDTSSLLTPCSQSKLGLKEDNYSLYYNEKELLDNDEKEKCSSGEQSYMKADVLFPDNTSDSHVSIRTRKSFSVGKIKNKLDFLHIFSNRKNKLKNSTSADEFSNIKYKKMNSVKSTLF